MKKSAPSICSQESGGSVWDSNGQAQLFKQLPSVSEINLPSKSLKSTGPTSQSTTMSKLSQQMDLEESIWSQQASLVSLGVWQEKEREQKIKKVVTSGQRWLPLLKNYVQDSSLAKTCEVLLTNKWVSNAVSLTWKVSGMKPSHLLFQLLPSIQQGTDETGCGFLPTPTASDAVRAKFKKKSILKSLENGGQMTLIYLVTLSQAPKVYEAMMGFPKDWTKLESDPLGMQSSPKSSNKSDKQSSKDGSDKD